jgi:predicted HTH transcriptional regulator
LSKYIKSLIEEGEHQKLDFKFEISNARKIARTMSAFANAQGGTLLIGVKDNGKIAGIQTEEEKYMVESAAELYCKPPVKYITNEWIVDGKQVLEVKVFESEQKPHLAPYKDEEWRAYIRVDDENFMANAVMMQVWKNVNKEVIVRYNSKEQILFSYLKKKKEITLSAYKKKAKINPFLAQKILANLISIGVLKVRITEKGAYYSLSEVDET